MTIAAVGSYSSGSSSQIASSATTLASNFETFLSLITTQLKNQDPSNPVDSNQFTQQLVQFAGVQQQLQTNQYLEKLLAAVQGNQIGNAAAYVGTVVEAPGNQGALIEGNASFGYTLPDGVSRAQVSIVDASGRMVFTGTGTTLPGKNVVSWDGVNSFTGQHEPNGVYTLNIAASDSNGKNVSANQFIIGRVTSTQIANGEVVVDIGDLHIPASQITNISNLAS